MTAGFDEAFERAFAYILELPQATWSPWSPDSKSVLSSQPYDDDGALRLVPIDGSEPRLLLQGSFFTPTWSPDGKAIAFGARRAPDGLGPTELWTMSVDGSNRRCLVTAFAPAWLTPVWSPDGRWIAYCTESVEVVRTDGSERISLGSGAMPVWSPDGARIAYSMEDRSSDAAFGCIQIASLSGAGTTRLTNGTCPSWAPNGERLVFQDAGEDNESLTVLVIDADGSNRQRLCAGLFPRWSPRGDRILVQGVDDTLVTIAPDGSDERVIATDARFGRWSPDGEWIAFQWKWNVYVIRADGTERRALRVGDQAPAAEP